MSEPQKPEGSTRKIQSPLKLAHISKEPHARSIIDSLAQGEIVETSQIENAVQAVRDMLVIDAKLAKRLHKSQADAVDVLDQEAKEAAKKVRVNLHYVLLLNGMFQKIVPLLFSATDALLQSAKTLEDSRTAQRRALLKGRDA